MKKIALIIENNATLNDLWFVNNFLKSWTGDVIDFSRFQSKSREEIFGAVSKCTDIVCQTALVNGSEVQLEGMVAMLAKIKAPKNIHLAFLGSNGVFEYLDANFSDEELLAISHHSIFEMTYDEEKPVVFTERINLFLEKQAQHKQYLADGKTRLTGRKILILACNAGGGSAFSGLPIGQEVDEVDMSDADENTHRGVWVWGNGVPVKLVNDCGLQEYKIVSKLSAEEKVVEIFKTIGIKITDRSFLETNGIAMVIEDEEFSSMEKANIICEELQIEKRGNRQKIYQLIN